MANPIPSRPSFTPSNLFFRDIPRLTREVESSMRASQGDSVGFKDIANLVAGYVGTDRNPFGAAEWKEHFGVDVGPEPPLGKDFEQFWNGPDPVDVFENVEHPRSVWETHLRPVLGFRFCTRDNTLHARSLQTLNQLGLQFRYNSEALQQNRNKKAGPTCWLVMRKDVLARNQTWAEQQQYLKELNAKTGARYEEQPSAIDLATVVFPYKEVDGERHLGDDTGAEGQWTYSRCGETVKYENNDNEYHLVVGGSAPSGAVVGLDYDVRRVASGIAALRKF